MRRISKYLAIVLAICFLHLAIDEAQANAVQKQHWLYKVIPKSRAEARGASLITWAVFGNDMEGIFGERSIVPTYGEMTTRNFVRWWIRNPFHNLSWHVLDWPRKKVYVLVEIPGQKTFFWREPRNWVADDHQFQVVLIPPFISWRTDKWEGYLGWRSGGEFGIAFRRA